jgi:hypothetical protein
LKHQCPSTNLLKVYASLDSAELKMDGANGDSKGTFLPLSLLFVISLTYLSLQNILPRLVGMITPLLDKEMITDLQDMTTVTSPHDTEIETVAVTEEIEIETVKSDTMKTPPPPITEVPIVTVDEIILPPREENIVLVEAIIGLPVAEITHLVAEASRMSIPLQENIEIIDMIIEEGVQVVLMEIEVAEVGLEGDIVDGIVNEVFLQREHVAQLQI